MGGRLSASEAGLLSSEAGLLISWWCGGRLSASGAGLLSSEAWLLISWWCGGAAGSFWGKGKGYPPRQYELKKLKKLKMLKVKRLHQAPGPWARGLAGWLFIPGSVGGRLAASKAGLLIKRGTSIRKLSPRTAKARDNFLILCPPRQYELKKFKKLKAKVSHLLRQGF